MNELFSIGSGLLGVSFDIGGYQAEKLYRPAW